MTLNVPRSAIAHAGLVTVLVISASCGGGGGGPTTSGTGLTASEQQTVQGGVTNAAGQAASQGLREVPKTVQAPIVVSAQVACPAGGSASASGNINVVQTSISGNLNISFNNCGVGSSLVVAGGPVSVAVSGSCPPALTVRVSGSVRVLRQVGGNLVPATNDFNVSGTATARC